MIASPLQPTAAGTPPDWVQLLPDGPNVVGLDGRNWLNDSPDRVVAAFQARNRPLPIDWEHATETRATIGLEAPAAGWINRMEARGGAAIWGNVAWTTRAAQQIVSREYRYLSPVFIYEKESGRIRAITSAALTNTPNLTMAALNRPSASPSPSFSLTPEERALCRRLERSESEFARARQTFTITPVDTETARLLTPDERSLCRNLNIPYYKLLAAKATVIGGKIIYG